MRSSRRSSRRTSPRPSRSASGDSHRGSAASYPIPAYLNFTPGGITYPRPGEIKVQGGRSENKDAHFFMLNQLNDPVRLISRAMECDGQLQNLLERNSDSTLPFLSTATAAHRTNPAVNYVPSLSFLMEAIFHPLTGVPAAQVRHWLDSVLLLYFSLDTASMIEKGVENGACSNCTLAAAAVGSTLDVTNLTPSGGSTSPGGEKQNKQPSLTVDSRSYSGESSAGSISSGSTGGVRSLGSSSTNPSSSTGSTSTSVQLQSLMKHLASHHSSSTETTNHHRPCGYVFKRGDIAWNCRTCQTDATCVLCDTCFHNSNHEGHEVFFHRTSPGGCCDCGDIEAWSVEGCCDAHRPKNVDKDKDMADAGNPASFEDLEDEFEAVKSAIRGRESNVNAVASLPPCLRSALGVVIGAAVQCIVRAVDGAGIGADVSQWKMRWAEQVANIVNKCVHEEEYALKEKSTAADAEGIVTPHVILNGAFRQGDASLSPSPRLVDTSNPWNSASSAPPAQDAPRKHPDSDAAEQRGWDGLFPQNYRLHLRLHNDDVHTFDEVIDALYERSSTSNNSSDPDSGPGLVTYREDADTMTHHVDSDGQVTVKSYSNFASALQGFNRLKSRGLLCSVVSTPQVDLELRARSVMKWLMEMSKLHGGVSALVVHALVDVTNGDDELVDGCGVWPEPRMCVFPWGRRFEMADYGWTTREDARDYFWRKMEQQKQQQQQNNQTQLQSLVFSGGMNIATDDGGRNVLGNDRKSSSNADADFDDSFYSNVPFHLPSKSLHKSPHALWGTLRVKSKSKAPSLSQTQYHRRQRLVIVDTDIRKQQEADTLTTSLHPHRLAGLSIISGVALFEDGFVHSPSGTIIDPVTSSYRTIHNLTVSQREISYLVNSKTSFQAPSSPLLLMLLLDPYPTKQFRYALHNLFLSLLTESRFKARFAAVLGAVSYRPLTTLFCAGVGTEGDTPLGFTVQIFTAGSLVRALGSCSVTKCLLECDRTESQTFANKDDSEDAFPTRALPIALTIVRAIHTNLLGSTKEVQMLLQNTAAASASSPTGGSNGGAASSGDSSSYRQLTGRGGASPYSAISTSPQNSHGDQATFSPAHAGQGYLPALVYQNGEQPQNTLLPAAPDDGFLDSRSTRHKRLPHLLRDLEYIFETPGTALNLLLQYDSSNQTDKHQKKSTDLEFPGAFARLLRLAQNMDPQKRKISGGHVEYEQRRWLDAFSLSLHLAATRDALVESPTLLSSLIAPRASTTPQGSRSVPLSATRISEGNKKYYLARKAMGNLFTALLREIKLCLYREGLLENGLLPASYSAHSHAGLALGQMAEALQRSTLHVSSPTGGGGSPSGGVALACATGVKMTEVQLNIIESALRYEYGYNQALGSAGNPLSVPNKVEHSGGGVIMGDWLKVPHSPLSGDWLSFHLPLHRALARTIKSLCSIPVPQRERDAYPSDWWKLPVLDGSDYYMPVVASNTEDGRPSFYSQHNHLSQLLIPTLKSSNCRVVWSNPDASPEQNQVRKIRSFTVSSAIAAAKVIHSLADHPLRCVAASTQIEKHLWARNGSAAAGMAHNYGSAPLCKSFRDLDLCLLQFSGAGFDVGLGARRTLALMLSRFSMDGYLCDPVVRRSSSTGSTMAGSGVGNGHHWVPPPRLQDPDHAPALAESFFATICLLVTELPPPPPTCATDDSTVRKRMRRELLHALAAEPRSYSEALAAALSGATKGDHHFYNQSSGSGGGGGLDSSRTHSTSLRSIFSDLLREVAHERQASRGSGSTRSGSGAPTYELKADASDEYDPSFYHLRRNEHQHAMDTVARLRKAKCALSSAKTSSEDRFLNARIRTKQMSNSVRGEKCLPLVAPPPEAHPRFLPVRLILHLPTMDAAVRRKLLFALTGGRWLPPAEPVKEQPGIYHATSSEDDTNSQEHTGTSDPLVSLSLSSSGSFGSARSSSKRSTTSGDHSAASSIQFSPAVVAASSVSSLEVLQILTLQVHTLEHCAALHRTQKLDSDSSQLSSTITVNSYLARLCHVPSSLDGCWALGCPDPLPSAGSGQNRGSILGLLIALYEHCYFVSREDSSFSTDNDRSSAGTGDESHSGGARALACDGLKWLLRFVHALVHGAPSVGAAIQSATDGVPISPHRSESGACVGSSGRFAETVSAPGWTIAEDIEHLIGGMLDNLPQLWPSDEKIGVPSNVGMPMKATANKKSDGLIEVSTGGDLSTLASEGSHVSAVPSPNSGSSPEAKGDMSKAKLDLRKAAQQRALKMMSMQRSKFLDSLGGGSGDDTEDMDVDSEGGDRIEGKYDDGEKDECIICHCAADDSDSPLGYLGHVQRSRALQLRSLAESGEWNGDSRFGLNSAARVVGDRGCQLRATASMDSAPVACLPLGSIVTVIQSKVSPKYGLSSRRVLVRHVVSSKNGSPGKDEPQILEGWASVQSSQGYVILAPLSKLCFSRWGATRPMLRLCGHAAHLDCVEAHCLSLHQRAAGDHPYDGRFAANIEEGEFLCPLCKQISNVLVPKQLSAPITGVEAHIKGLREEEFNFAGPDEFLSLRQALVKRHLDRYASMCGKKEKKSDDNALYMKECEAMRRFGSQLYQAMQVAWERPASYKRRNKEWNSFLRKWDYEEEFSSTEKGGDKSATSNGAGAGVILRLLREQHIAWSAVGYGAASAEASMRVSNRRVIGDTSCSSSSPSSVCDPWTGYDQRTRDSHASLLELKRIIGASAGFLNVVGTELGSIIEQQVQADCEENSPGREFAGVALVGQLLFDLLNGKHGNFSSCAASTSETKTTDEEYGGGAWRILGALISAMPVHVARDGLLSPRHEARSTSAAMWALKGHGSSETSGDSTAIDDLSQSHLSVSRPPLCIRKVCKGQDPATSKEAGIPGQAMKLTEGWGTCNIFDLLPTAKKNEKSLLLPFRPAVASSFLYLPLLSWDLNTLAGALFSCLHYNPTEITCDDFARVARCLLVGRLVQVLITPNGYAVHETKNLNEKGKSMSTSTWKMSETEKLNEGRALSQLETDFAKRVSGGLDTVGEQKLLLEGEELFSAVGDAILPFARTIVLLLRVGLSTLRQKRSQKVTQKPSGSERNLTPLVEDPSVMSCGNGLIIMKILGGPLPSQLCSESVVSEKNIPQNGWFTIIKRWLNAVIALESHHGSRGNTTYFDRNQMKWVASYVKHQDQIGLFQRAKVENLKLAKGELSKNQSAVSDPTTDISVTTSGVAVVASSLDQITTEAETSAGNSAIAMEDDDESGQRSIDLYDPDAMIDDDEGEDDGVNDNGASSESFDDDENVGDYDEDEEMDEDEGDDERAMQEGGDEGAGGFVVSNVGFSRMVDDEDMDSDDEEMDAAVEAVNFDDGGLAGDPAVLFGLTRRPTASSSAEWKDEEEESSERSVSSVSNNDSDIERKFADVSRGVIIPFQPSLLAKESIGPGPRGNSLDAAAASRLMYDLSHLGLIHRDGMPGSGLIKLPLSFVELYSLVNKVKGDAVDDQDDGGSSETAICLITGAVMRSGSVRRFSRSQARPPGACTIHARKTGSGIGVFFLVQKCTVLLMHNNKSAYSASLYVDENGEEDPGLRRGRPLALQETRYKALESLWRQHGIPREVAQIRSTSDRVIRDNWY